MLVWVPAILMAVLFVMPGDPLGWLAVAAVIALVGLCSAWEIVVWLRQAPPVVVDAGGIDLQGSGPVPWREVRAVVIDSHRLWLELNRDTAAFVASRTFPPWFTAAHENLWGDAAWIARQYPRRVAMGRRDTARDCIADPAVRDPAGPAWRRVRRLVSSLATRSSRLEAARDHSRSQRGRQRCWTAVVMSEIGALVSVRPR
jgi:hypothetical protein